MLYFTKVRWLSSGKVLKRFFELRAEVKAFMEKNGMAISVLSDPEWLMDLAFDITQTSLDNLREMAPTSPELYRMFKQSMCIFGTTNLCEKLFSTMSLSQSSGPNLQISILKHLSCFVPQAKLWLSCVRGSAAKSKNHNLQQFAVANYRKRDAHNLVVRIFIKENLHLSDSSKTIDGDVGQNLAPVIGEQVALFSSLSCSFI